MPQRSNEFQRLIAFIETEFAPAGWKVTESALVRDIVGGVDREVDILIEGLVDTHPVSIGIECRDRKRPADVGWIDAIIGKYAHLPIKNVVAVSRTGFSANALAKARQNGIQTLSLEEALETNWLEDYDRVVDWTMEGRRLIYKGVGFDLGAAGESQAPTDFDGSSILMSEDGKPLGPAQALVDWIYSTPTFVREAIKREVAKWSECFAVGINIGLVRIDVPANLLYQSGNGSLHRIRRISVKVECRVEKIKAEYHEYIYSNKYIAKASAKFEDVPLELSAAAVQAGDDPQKGFRWLISHNLEER